MALNALIIPSQPSVYQNAITLQELMTPEHLEIKNANIHRITVVPNGSGYLACWDGEPIQAYGASPWLAFHAAEYLIVKLAEQKDV